MLVGLTGAKGSGKDTFAEALVDEGFELVRFADPLKNMLRSLYRDAGLDAELIERKIEGDLKEEPCDILSGKTPRHAMQTLGTEWRDMIDRNLWTKIWQSKVDMLEASGRNIVTPDVRFHHEAENFDPVADRLYRIERPSTGGVDQHISEVEGLSIITHSTILNDGSVSKLHEKAKRIIRDNYR